MLLNEANNTVMFVSNIGDSDEIPSAYDDEWYALRDRVLELHRKSGREITDTTRDKIASFDKYQLREAIDRYNSVIARANNTDDDFDQPLAADYFVMLSRTILTNTEISDLALRVYLVLLDFARGKGECFPKVKTIAAAVGRKSETETREALAELERHNLIRRDIRKPKTTLYRLRKTPAIKPSNHRNHRKRGE